MPLASYQLDAKRILKEAAQTDDFPNFLVYGPPGSGKKTVVNEFLVECGFSTKQIYRVNCGLNIGVNEVRTQINEYAASVVLSSEGSPNFKVIILNNAELLTIEAQSALRRCIEERSHLTRFLFICQSKNGIMKPLQSRAVPLYIGEFSDKKYKNWHKTRVMLKDTGNQRWLLRNLKTSMPASECLKLCSRAATRGISTKDTIAHLSDSNQLDPVIAAHLINVSSSFKNERLGIALVLMLTGDCKSMDTEFLSTINRYTFTDM